MIRHSWFCIVLLLAAIPIGAQEPDTRIGIRFHAAYGPSIAAREVDARGLQGSFGADFFSRPRLGIRCWGAMRSSNRTFIMSHAPRRRPHELA